MTISPINNNINPNTRIASILNYRIQELTKKRDVSVKSLKDFRTYKELLAEIQKEAREINKNHTTTVNIIKTVKFTDADTVNKVFSSKIRISDDNNYQTGDEIKLSYSTDQEKTYFARKLNDKEIALYETKEQAESDSSTGKLSFSGDEDNTVINKVIRETNVVTTQNYKETEKFKELYSKLKEKIGASPLSTKDFDSFDSKISRLISDTERGKITNLDNQVKKLEKSIAALQNLIPQLGSFQNQITKNIGFFNKMIG